MTPPYPLGRSWPRWLGALFLSGSVYAAPAPAVESVQTAVADWARIRAETVRLQGNWDGERELLTTTITALQDRIRGLEDAQKALEAKTSGDREALATLGARTAATETALQAAEVQLRRVSAELTQLRPWLPPRLAQALELPYRSLADARLTVGERMQFVTTVLNRCAQFNRTITCGEEVVPVAGAKDGKLLEVIYWGLSHAYALDRNAGQALLGAPGPQGWAWEPAADAAPAVARAIGIYRDQGDPDFIELPARYSDAVPPTSAQARP